MTPWNRVLERIDQYRWRLPRSYQKGMNTDGIIFADDALMKLLDREEAIGQVANVACLPGIVGQSLAMPDIHWGYGFPIGGVAAFDPDNGIISPGGIGYDINCGVRLLKTNLDETDIAPQVGELLDGICSLVPCGVGKEGAIRLKSRKELNRVLELGASWAVKKGFGVREDLEHTGDNGCLGGADPGVVSERAFKRGENQLGTLGSGNHFIEIQVVDEIFDPEAAGDFGLWPGMVMVMIHTGSRGMGHQVATDYISLMGKALAKYGIHVPDRQLACAPIKSPPGREYLAAMASAANYAWANRQIISHRVREAFERVLRASWEHLGMDLIYDVSHNIASMEEYSIDGKKKTLLIHRKGATRSLGPGRKELPPAHRNTGQAVIIPGDMGRYSYVLAGTGDAERLSFSSTCHGAGRVMSRGAAKKAGSGRDVARQLEDRGIAVRCVSWSGLAEEAPLAYKDVADVVNTAHGAGIARKVARLRPLGVLKG